MSAEEWAHEIQRLIEQAEDDGMRFFIRDGDFLVSGHRWDPDYQDHGVFIW